MNAKQLLENKMAHISPERNYPGLYTWGFSVSSILFLFFIANKVHFFVTPCFNNSFIFSLVFYVFADVFHIGIMKKYNDRARCGTDEHYYNKAVKGNPLYVIGRTAFYHKIISYNCWSIMSVFFIVNSFFKISHIRNFIIGSFDVIGFSAAVNLLKFLFEFADVVTLIVLFLYSSLCFFFSFIKKRASNPLTIS